MTLRACFGVRRLCCSLCAVAVSVACVGGVAFAADADEYTFEGVGFRFGALDQSNAGPPVSLTQLGIYSDVLGLDDDQRLIARGLWETALDEHRRTWTMSREALADLRAVRAASEAGDRAFMVMLSSDSTEEAQAINERYEREREGIVRQFFDELRVVLTREQEERWGALEQAVRRQETLAAWSTFSEERADLVELVHALDVGSMPSELEAVLEEYSSVLDGVLVSRNRLSQELGDVAEQHSEFRAGMVNGFAGVQSQEDQQAAVQRMMAAREQMEALGREGVRLALSTRSSAARVRDMNVQYAQRIEEALGGEGTDLADRFRVAFGRFSERVREEGPRGIFGRSRAEMALNEALAIGTRARIRAIQQEAESFGVMVRDGGIAGLFGSRTEAEALTEDQAEQVESLRVSYETQRAAIQRLWADELQVEEEAVLRIGSPAGKVRLNRVEPEGEGGVRTEFRFVVSSGGGAASFDEEAGPPEGYLKDVASLEQSIIDQLRSILTLDQRAVIANF